MATVTHNAGRPRDIFLAQLAYATGKAPGVEVPCNGCTRCCRGNFPVYPLAEQVAEYDCEVDATTGKARLRHKPDGSCIYLNNNRCSIYERRPGACIEYDCRLQLLAGLRNMVRGEPINKRLDSWRLTFVDDLDLGILASMWEAGHEACIELGDVGAAVTKAFLETTLLKREGLQAIVDHNRAAILATIKRNRLGEFK